MSNKKQCTCDIPFSDCPHAIEFPHGDKWYCTLRKTKVELELLEENETIGKDLTEIGVESQISTPNN